MIVAPSLLAANFAKLGEDIDMINRSNAAWVHCDVMDGVFVPNISFGFPVIKAVSALTDKPLDVHLMIVDPGRYVSQVRDCGAIRAAGMKPAVTLNPATPVTLLQDIIEDLDMVLLMSVNPGFGGQSFIEHTIKKIKELRKLITETGSKTLIEIDGGINTVTGALVASAGADVLVAGNAVFSAANPLEEINSLASL